MSTLATIAATLPADQRRRIATAIPQAIQTAAHTQVAAIEVALRSEFVEWASAGGMAADWAERYAAATIDRAATLYTMTASLTADYAAMITAYVLEEAAWDEARAARIATANWRYTPITILGNAMRNGADRTQAIDTASRHAAGIGSLDVHTAQRDAITDMERTSEGLITGQRKEPGGGACGWCLVVASQNYSKQAQVPSHRNDRCGVAPIVRGDDSQQILADRRNAYAQQMDWRQATQIPAGPPTSGIDPYSRISEYADQ